MTYHLPPIHIITNQNTVPNYFINGKNVQWYIRSSTIFFFFLIQALTFQATILQNNLPVPISEKAIVLKYDNIVFNNGQSGTSKYKENKYKLHFSTYNVLHNPPPHPQLKIPLTIKANHMITY